MSEEEGVRRRVGEKGQGVRRILELGHEPEIFLFVSLPVPLFAGIVLFLKNWEATLGRSVGAGRVESWEISFILLHVLWAMQNQNSPDGFSFQTLLERALVCGVYSRGCIELTQGRTKYDHVSSPSNKDRVAPSSDGEYCYTLIQSGLTVLFCKVKSTMTDLP